jgi:hypothetical protein
MAQGHNGITLQRLSDQITFLTFASLRLYAFEPFYTLIMNCRPECGACCIASSISSPLPGMSAGKPAGVRCIHLLDDYKCAIYTKNDKPTVCTDFKADKEFCGSDREEAMRILYSLSESSGADKV